MTITINWNEIVKNHANMVRGVCYEYEKDTDKLKDLIQEVWLRAFEKQDTFKGDSHISTWLYRVAATVASNHVREEVARPTLVQMGGDGGEDDDSMDVEDVAEAEQLTEPGADEVVYAEQLLAQFHKDAARWKHGEEILRLHHVEGVGVLEIARKLKVRVGHVTEVLDTCERNLEITAFSQENC